MILSSKTTIAPINQQATLSGLNDSYSQETQKKEIALGPGWEFLDDKSFLKETRHIYDTSLYEDEYDDTYDSLEPLGNIDADSADELQDTIMHHQKAEKTEDDLRDLVSDCFLYYDDNP
jgi:hypothetical protein